MNVSARTYSIYTIYIGEFTLSRTAEKFAQSRVASTSFLGSLFFPFPGARETGAGEGDAGNEVGLLRIKAGSS